MLTPSMDYEVGRGRMLELEQKLAARRLLDEALASQRLQQPSLLDRLVERMKKTAEWVGHRGSTLPGVDADVFGMQQPAA